MKKLICIILTICTILSIGIVGVIVGCTPSPDRIRLYYTDINVEIIDIQKDKYYDEYMHYDITVTVYSEEYDITEVITEYGYGLIIPLSWNYEKGDIITVRMYSKIIESTGEVLERKISGFIEGE